MAKLQFDMIIHFLVSLKNIIGMIISVVETIQKNVGGAQ